MRTDGLEFENATQACREILSQVTAQHENDPNALITYTRSVNGSASVGTRAAARGSEASFARARLPVGGRGRPWPDFRAGRHGPYVPAWSGGSPSWPGASRSYGDATTSRCGSTSAAGFVASTRHHHTADPA